MTASRRRSESGDPIERKIRLPSLFAICWSASWAAAFGALWLIGRIIYFVGHLSDPKKRFPGFFILLLGALGRALKPPFRELSPKVGDRIASSRMLPEN
ncbi:MAPEG family protein [Bradyrhizobium sp. 156]|uniref:MAPEG family protein n=1 Tax=Bradyrhizobium sp. 156 TaxID=2782630 RepID=UPI001FF7EC19|nr:MAPEG family protein [Bradyrhizobium sp. 156]MCK1326451.1 MAPEG family protein [Bradyrhizobium sp. 156]